MRRLTLGSLAVLFIFFMSSPGWVLAQQIRISGPEAIKIDPAANFQGIPVSICITEDKLVLIPDPQAGNIKIFNKEGNFWKFLKTLGPNFDNKGFEEPRYCLYSRNEGKLGIIDYKAKSVFIFERQGKVEFQFCKDFECKRFGYDMEFTGDGQKLVVSGYLADKKNNPFDLYSIDVQTGEINYLLPSYQKYNLKSHEEYVLEYLQKQTLPAIGIKGFIDIEGDDLFFVWEGALRIIRLNLASKEIMSSFGHESLHYIKPNGSNFGNSYIKGDFKTAWKEREKMAYVRNIFATPRHVFLIYETAKSGDSNLSQFRLQAYTPEGSYLEDFLIPGNPGPQMWLDKENYELYALSRQTGSNNGEFSLLRYQINK